MQKYRFIFSNKKNILKRNKQLIFDKRKFPEILEFIKNLKNALLYMKNI